MTTFTSPNQFDKKFRDSDIFGNFGNERNACSLFSLFTAYNFMINGLTTKEQHECNLDTAVMNYATHSELPTYLAFDELTQFMGGEYDANMVNNVKATTPTLLDEYGYNEIFNPDAKHDYAVIFLKNGNFITVLVKVTNIDDTYYHTTGYYVRDCHENEQWDFDNFDALQIHLNEKYQFQQLTIVDGVLIDEFANIEYLVINKPYTVTYLDPNLNENSDNINTVETLDEIECNEIQIEIDAEDIPEYQEYVASISKNNSRNKHHTYDDISQNIRDALNSDDTDNLDSSDYTTNSVDMDAMLAAQLQYGDMDDPSYIINGNSVQFSVSSNKEAKVEDDIEILTDDEPAVGGCTGYFDDNDGDY